MKCGIHGSTKSPEIRNLGFSEQMASGSCTSVFLSMSYSTMLLKNLLVFQNMKGF